MAAGSRWAKGVIVVLAAFCAVLPVSAFAAPSQIPPQLAPAGVADEIFYSTGVMTLVSGLSAIIDDELAHLSASSLFTADDIRVVRFEMRRVRPADIYADLEARLRSDYSLDELQQLLDWTRQAPVQALLAQERQLSEPASREAAKEYRQRMKATPPAAPRVALMQTLDLARQQTGLETAIKVEVRKNLLAAVSKVKTGKPLGEAALARELQSYHASVQKRLVGQATDAYLYVYRQTPSDQVQAAITVYQTPLFVRMMNTVREVMVSSIALARR